MAQNERGTIRKTAVGSRGGLPVARLISSAREVTRKAYVPYSGRAVGAALLGVDNMIYTGCAVENASAASSLCAERAAVAKAVSRGCRGFRAAAIVANDGAFAVPCGSCRQVLAEFAPGLTVILEDDLGKPVIYKLSDLLPNAFNLKL